MKDVIHIANPSLSAALKSIKDLHFSDAVNELKVGDIK